MAPVLLSALALMVLAGCAAKPEGVTQFNTIDSLLAGVYDGSESLDSLRRSGDFGIGTFDRLDGEMALIDGVFYQVKADGRVTRPAGSIITPFASVLFFRPELQCREAKGDYAGIRRLVDGLAPNQNIFAAVMIRGEFKSVHTRSVPAQVKPYRPLAEVTRNQPEFHLKNVRGTVVGFRLPPYVKGINVPGYHLHFIADDASGGGHILDFELERGDLELQTVYQLTLVLPRDSADFAAVDLGRDRGAELKKVESAKP
ncbi:MAG: acetolactate decarboxylase [Victivallaceae bacterium]